MPNISTVERGDWSRVEFLSSQPWIDECLPTPGQDCGGFCLMLEPLANVSLLLMRLRHAARVSGRAGMNCEKRQYK